MKAMCHAFAMGFLLVSSAVWADQTRVPTQEAFEKLKENQEKNPDNSGLQNATDRIFTNQQRQAVQRANHGKGTQSHGQAIQERSGSEQHASRDADQSPERVERVDRVERPEHPDRPERVAHGHHH